MPKYTGNKPLYRSYEFFNQEDLMSFVANKKLIEHLLIWDTLQLVNKYTMRLIRLG